MTPTTEDVDVTELWRARARALKAAERARTADLQLRRVTLEYERIEQALAIARAALETFRRARDAARRTESLALARAETLGGKSLEKQSPVGSCRASVAWRADDV